MPERVSKKRGPHFLFLLCLLTLKEGAFICTSAKADLMWGHPYLTSTAEGQREPRSISNTHRFCCGIEYSQYGL